MNEPQLYIFDGYNLLHAGAYSDAALLVNDLASFVALEGARGIVVFDGGGEDQEIGPLSVRFAGHADTLIERLAAEWRDSALVHVVSTDAAIRQAAGPSVRVVESKAFLARLTPDAAGSSESPRATRRVADRLDDETRAALERLRRGL